MCHALQDSGFDVVYIGQCPSLVLYFSLFQLPVDGGLMITASHNGPEYNGIKICLGKESVWGTEIQEIQNMVKQSVQSVAQQKGKYQEHLLVDEYIVWLKDHFSDLVGMKLSAVIDCGNGAAGTVMPDLIQAMEWPNVKLLYPEVDGTYPNHEADPIVEANMKDVRHILLTTDTEVGLGLDGDCDRMAAMTKNGELIQGDKLLALFSRQVLQSYPGARIVYDIKCSSALSESIQQAGGVPVLSPSGHSIIKDQMKKNNALLAGELSCHFFFQDRYFGYDDGIYAALRLFQLLQQSGQPLSELLAFFPQRFITPEFRILCQEDIKNLMVQEITKQFNKRDDVSMLTIDGVRIDYGFGWGLLRASNTQACICLRFEADTAEHLDMIKEDFIDVLSPYFDNQELRAQLAS